MPICPALREGFADSNLPRISCQVSALWANPLSAKTAVANNPTHRRLKKRFMKPPRTFLAAPETQRLSNATGGGAPLRVGESVIDDVCPALRKAALMHACAPVYVFPNSGFICEGRRKVELDR